MHLLFRKTALMLTLLITPFNYLICADDNASKEVVHQQTVKTAKGMSKKERILSAAITATGLCVGIGWIALGAYKIAYGDTIRYTMTRNYADIPALQDLKKCLDQLVTQQLIKPVIKNEITNDLFANLFAAQYALSTTPKYSVERTEPAFWTGLLSVLAGMSLIKMTLSSSSTKESKATAANNDQKQPAATPATSNDTTTPETNNSQNS